MTIRSIFLDAACNSECSHDGSCDFDKGVQYLGPEPSLTGLLALLAALTVLGGTGAFFILFQGLDLSLEEEVGHVVDEAGRKVGC